MCLAKSESTFTGDAGDSWPKPLDSQGQLHEPISFEELMQTNGDQINQGV